MGTLQNTSRNQPELSYNVVCNMSCPYEYYTLTNYITTQTSMSEPPNLGRYTTPRRTVKTTALRVFGAA